MKIRSTTIYTTEWQGAFGCDVLVRLVSGEEIVLSTGLYTHSEDAQKAAKGLQDSVWSMSEKDLEFVYQNYMLREHKNPFKGLIVPEE